MTIAIITTIGTLLGTILGSYLTNQATIKSNNINHHEERKRRYETFIRKTLISYLPLMKSVNSTLYDVILNSSNKEYTDDDYVITKLLRELNEAIKFYESEIVENAPIDLIGDFSEIHDVNTSFRFYVDIHVNDLHKSKEFYKKMLDKSEASLKQIEKQINEKYI